MGGVFQILELGERECRSSNSISNFRWNIQYNTYWGETGRAAILSRKDLQTKQLPLNNAFLSYYQLGYESCWIQFNPGSGAPFIFCSLYRNNEYKSAFYKERKEPNDSHFDLHAFSQEVAAARRISSNIIICADANASNPLWFSSTLDSVGAAIGEFAADTHLECLNDEAYPITFEGNNSQSSIDVSLSDVTLAPRCENWRTNDTRYDLGSDHLPITFQIRLPNVVNRIPQAPRKAWKITDNTDWEKFQETLNSKLEDWPASGRPENCSYAPDELDATVESWTNLVVEVGKATIGEKTVYPGSKPWWSREINLLRKGTQKLKQRLRKANRLVKRFGSSFKPAADALFEEYRSTRRKLQNRLAEEKQKWLESQFAAMTLREPRKMYQTFKALTSSPLQVIPTLTVNGENASTDLEKCDALSAHFAEPPNPPNSSNSSHYDMVERTVSLFLSKKEEELDFDEKDEEKEELDGPSQEHNFEITTEEILEAISFVGAHKAYGPDQIPNIFLKNGGDELVETLRYLFNCAFTIGHFPKPWKRWNIAPIPKPGRDHSICKNHRPIALLSCVGKIYERILSRRLLWWIRQENSLCPSQAGFQSHHNTSELLLRLTETACKAINHSSVTYAVALDISSAYDSVWRNGLRYKLREQFNVKGRLFWALDGFLANREGRVVINGKHSNWRPFDVGVPQGSSLSPLLFILYINDLHEVILPSVELGAFADDVTLWNPFAGNTVEILKKQHRDIQTSLDNAYSWAVDWKMILSPAKSSAITFRHPNKRRFPGTCFTLNGTQIPFSPKMRYLGLILDSSLSYKDHVMYVFGKGMKRLGLLTFLCNQGKSKPSYSSYLTLYKTILRPVLDYASAFWNGAPDSYKEKLQRIQRIALCRIVGCFRTTSYNVVNALTHVAPLELRRQQEEVKLLHRCIKYSEAYPRGNLSSALAVWRSYPGFGSKISTLGRATIHAHGARISNPPPLQEKHPNICPAVQLRIPPPSHSPFPLNSSPNAGVVRLSMEDSDVVLFTDGSCFPNPGIGGAGVVITNHGTSWIEQEFPVDGITSNIMCEILAMAKAIEFCKEHLDSTSNRIIIFSDCLFVVNCIKNLWHSSLFYREILDCKKSICALSNIPEIYWVKAHAGNPGNERADLVAKRAAGKARDRQPELEKELQNSEWFTHSVRLEKPFEMVWERDWTNPAWSNEHFYAKKLFPSFADIQPLFGSLAPKLDYSLRKVWARLLTGKIALNYYLYSINRAFWPFCDCCEPLGKEETVEHFILECPRYARQRLRMFNRLIRLVPSMGRHDFSLRTLLTGDGIEKKLQFSVIRTLLKFALATNRKL